MSQISILEETLYVINIGLEMFAEDLRSEGVKVIHVDWRPPAGGDTQLIQILSKLDDPD